MKKILVIPLMLLVVLSFCKSTKSMQSKLVNNKELISIEISKSYALGEKVDIKISNISQEKLVLYNPTKPRIQKKEQDNWRTIRILTCPCDAPCNAPPEKIDFPANKQISLSWDQIESYCGKRVEAGIRETISKKVGSGKYRLVTTYKMETKKNIIYNEFTIN